MVYLNTEVSGIKQKYNDFANKFIFINYFPRSYLLDFENWFESRCVYSRIEH